LISKIVCEFHQSNEIYGKEIWELKREEREAKIQENSQNTKQEKVRKLKSIRREKMAKCEEQNRRWKIIYDNIIGIM